MHQLIAYRLFRRQALRFCHPAHDDRINDKIKQLCAEMGIKKQVKPLISKKVLSPMMTGFAKPLLLFPNEDYTDVELTFILKHELTHFKRHDLWYKLLLLIANAVHWFNPLAYFMFREAGKDLELSCDDEVIKGTSFDNRKQYSETILASIHRIDSRNSALTTYFYGGTKTIKERFLNILNTRNKRRGTVALCVVLAAVCAAGGLVACQQISAENAEQIDNISLQDAGNSYTFNGNKLAISFNGGTSAEVELPIDTSVTYAEEQTGVYISDQITAVVYGGLDGQSPAKIMVSGDMGKTWDTYTVKGSDAIDDSFIGKWIGFITPNDGWLVLDGNVGAGTQRHYIFETADGGKSWTEIGNANDVYAKILTGAVFASDDIGFLCFIRVDDSPAPTIYQTQDKGQTWQPLTLTIPGEYQNGAYRIDAESPVFNGANGVLPVVINTTAGSSLKKVADGQYVTSDYGKTWTYETHSDSNTSFEPGTTYSINAASRMVVSYDAGSSFSLDEQGNVLISYNNGEAPLALDVSDNYDPGMEADETGFYISKGKTAIAYGGDDGPVQVLISDDMGKTWNTYAVEGSEYNRATKIVGFVTKDDGFLVASPGSALGTSNNYVYLTSDGGKTWTEIGNPNDVYPRNMTGAGFSTKDIGFYRLPV